KAPDVNGDPFSVVVPLDETMVRAISPGDGVVIVKQQNGAHLVRAFARVYRVRNTLESSNLLFDGVLPLEPSQQLSPLGLTAPHAIIERIDWPNFAGALKRATGKEFTDLL